MVKPKVMYTAPNLLSVFRLVLVPVLFYLAWTGKSTLFLVFFTCALFSDCVDGFLARKLNQVSEFGTKLDTWADFAMYMSLPICAWWLWPDVIRREAPFVIAAVTSYIVPIIFAFLKYGRNTSYHTWGAKLSAVLMSGAMLVIFAGGPAWPFRLFTPFFVLVELEEIAMTAILSEWRANVPTFWHAMKFKEQERRSSK